MMNLIFTIARFHVLGWDCEMPRLRRRLIVGLDSFTSLTRASAFNRIYRWVKKRLMGETFETVITTDSCAR